MPHAGGQTVISGILVNSFFFFFWSGSEWLIFMSPNRSKNCPQNNREGKSCWIIYFESQLHPWVQNCYSSIHADDNKVDEFDFSSIPPLKLAIFLYKTQTESISHQNWLWSTSSSQEAGLAGNSGYPPLLPVDRSELGPFGPAGTMPCPPWPTMGKPESGYTRLEMRGCCLGRGWSEAGDCARLYGLLGRMSWYWSWEGRTDPWSKVKGAWAPLWRPRAGELSLRLLYRLFEWLSSDMGGSSAQKE